MLVKKKDFHLQWVQAQLSEQLLIPIMVQQYKFQNCIINLSFVKNILWNIKNDVFLQAKE
jgi:hypothetical protein